MTEAAARSVLSKLGEIREGKSPQGFYTLACNTSNYSEYLLIYLQDGKVVGICGIGKSMSYDTAVAGQSVSNLSGWTNQSEYTTDSKKVAAKKKKVSATEQAYAFFDVLGDSTIYCIQVFDPTKVKDASNDMIYNTTNLSYDTSVTSSVATEIGHMLNAFRVYKGENAFTLDSGLAQCAQTYCNNATSTKLSGRPDSWNGDEPAPGSILAALWEQDIDPMYYGEACYTDAADAISFANSLIEMDDFYQVLLNTKVVDGDTVVWSYLGVGMAFNGKYTYVTVDYTNEI